MIKRYNKALTKSEIDQVMETLSIKAERVQRCSDPDLIAVNNGIFDYKAKRVDPFTPDIVFTAKSHVDYNPTASNVIIHNDEDNTDWDICSWIDDLFDDPEIPKLIWQIIGAVVRPNVRWNKSAFLYATSGNNGKGCICQLLRKITGVGTYVSIPLSDFGKDFMLEPLIRANAIITDENDVGAYLEKSANLKAVITNDVIQINRKHKTPLNYRFRGFMAQCVNSYPSVKDRSQSLMRRILLIPFDKCYTGAERKYIKDDYICRREVLEYVLFKVLNMDYYELDVPDKCKAALEEYKEAIDPVRAFLNEVLPDITWDALSNQLMFDLYMKWMEANNKSGTPLGKINFLEEMRNVMGSGMHGWKCYKEAKAVPKIAQWYVNDDPVLWKYGIKDCLKYYPGMVIKGLLRDNPHGHPPLSGTYYIATE